MTRRATHVLHVVMLVVVFCGPLAAAPQEGERSIREGTVELGVSGMLTSVESTLQAKLGLRGGTFFEAPLGLWGAEAEFSYATVRSLHQFDVEANVSWTLPVDAKGIFPYLALAGGVRIEHVGSFRQTLVPLGISAGLRVLVSDYAGVRLDAKVRRVTNDPVQNFTEVNLALGLSLFL
jgi:hypothetical protein